MTAIHELGHFLVGEEVDCIGLWVAIDTLECRKHYPEIWAVLDERHLSGCCRLSVPELDDFAEYCWVLAGWEAERLFLSEHGYWGAVYTRWRNYDNAKRILLYAMTDQARIADNACSRDPLAKAEAEALIRRVLSKTRPDTQEMLNILLKQGALILNPHECPVCTEAGYESNYPVGSPSGTHSPSFEPASSFPQTGMVTLGGYPSQFAADGELRNPVLTSVVKMASA